MKQVKGISKILSVLLIVALAFNITACQNAPKQQVTAVSSEAASASVATPESVAAEAPSESNAEQSLQSTVDYTDESNWAYYAIGDNKSADLFIVCPTVDMGKNGNYNMAMDDEKTKGNFVGALNMERGIYEDVTCLYAPYYRQITFPTYSLPDDEAKQYFDIAYSDVKAAFLQYIKDTPSDRPFVLAGFSQGSDMVIRLLKDLFSDKAYQDRLVAAYCIGWRITDDDLKECPWLKMAQGEDDLGVIISFNSEAVDINDSLLVPEGVKTYAINPLNWKTDSTVADASENKGACFTDYDGAITLEEPEYTGGYIDEERGTLKLPDIDPKMYSNKLFADGVYHLFDYQFFYRNLQENVTLRVERFCENGGNK